MLATRTIKNMDKGHSLGATKGNTLESGEKGSNMEKESL